MIVIYFGVGKMERGGGGWDGTLSYIQEFVVALFYFSFFRQ